MTREELRVPFHQDSYSARTTRGIKDFEKRFNLQFKWNTPTGKYTLKRRLCKEKLEAFDAIVQALEETYPDQYDIQFSLSAKYEYHENMYKLEEWRDGTFGSRYIHLNNNYEFRLFEKVVIESVNIIIHFPELTISNSRRESIDIKDLFIKTKVTGWQSKKEKLTFNPPMGSRTTVTIGEYESTYRHSHLNGFDFKTSDGNSICNFSNFCTGTSGNEGTDINMIQMMLNAEFDVDFLKAYLFHLKTFAEWESKEGVPYQHISDVINKNYSLPRITIDVCRSYYEYFLPYIKQEPDLGLEWEFKEGRYCIKDNYLLESLLIRMKESSSNNGIQQLELYFKDDKGEYFREQQVTTTELTTPRGWLPFRGNKIWFKIEGELKIAINRTQFIHPKIKYYVKSRLESEINEVKFRESRTKGELVS